MKQFIFTTLVIALGMSAGYAPGKQNCGMGILPMIHCLFADNASGEQNPGISTYDLDKTYADNYYRTASTAHAPLYGPLAEYIVGTYGLADMRGLGIDIGGGPGHLAVELARRTSGMQWINADINPYFFT